MTADVDAVARGKAIAERLASLPEDQRYPQPEADPLLAGIITAAELSHKVFPELAQFVPGVIVEGFGIVAGPPKLGKSWFTLVIALAVAAGGHAFGKIKCQQRPVLLLALEDSERRLQSRVKTLWGSEIPPHNLHLVTRVEPGLLVPTVTAWLQGHTKGLVILDTLGRARKARRANTDAYMEDYAAGVALKNIVDAFPGSGLLGVHHTRKASSDDFVDDLSGTQGLAGSADYVLVLRRPRNATDATLHLTGRDAPEGEYAFTVEAGQWILSGADLADAAAAAEIRRTEHRLSDRSVDILKVVNARAAAGQATSASDVEAKVGGVNAATARTYLSRLAKSDQIRQLSRGVYTSVVSVSSVANPPPS